MESTFEDLPRRVFLDSSTLQTLQTYGGFLYENEPISASDQIHRDPRGIGKLNALRAIMQVAERAPFEFALSAHSFEEVERRGDPGYLRWAYDVLDHWLACLEACGEPNADAQTVALLDTPSYNYLGAGDRALMKDALALECDSFLTMENRLPKCAEHLRATLGIRVLSPIEFWQILRPWAAIFC
jgi:hypothetical protein